MPWYFVWCQKYTASLFYVRPETRPSPTWNESAVWLCCGDEHPANKGGWTAATVHPSICSQAVEGEGAHARAGVASANHGTGG